MSRRVARPHALGEQALADDVADRHPRVERPERVLEDDLHLAPERPQLVRADVAQMSSPSNVIVPAVGGDSRRTVRPSVVLPQPDSPTRLNDLARRDVEVDAVDRVDRRRPGAAAARRRSGSASSGRGPGAAAARRGSAGSTPAAGRDRRLAVSAIHVRDAARPWRSAPAWSRRPASLDAARHALALGVRPSWPRAAARRVAPIRSGGGSAPAGRCRSARDQWRHGLAARIPGVRTAGLEAARRRQVERDGTTPLMTVRRLAALLDGRDRLEQAHRVRRLRGRGGPRRPCPCSTTWPAYMTIDVVDHLGDDAQVVGDQQQGRVGPLLDRLAGAPGSGPGSSRRARSWARRR